MNECGAILKEWPEGSNQGNFLSLSLFAISRNLYTVIANEAERQVGKGLKKITRKKIREIVNAPELKGVKLEKGHGSDFPIVIEEISFDGSREYATITAILQFPLHGDRYSKEEAIRRIIEGTGIEKLPCSQWVYGIEIKVILSGESLPYEITPSPVPMFYRKGRRAFFTQKEVLSGKYSPIIE